MAKIIKTGTIGGRDYWIVERYRDTDGWPRSLGEQFQLLGLGLPPDKAWLCGYLDASDLDGIEYDDPRLADLDGVASLTYSGRGIPNAEHTPTNGWWLGVDTADLRGVATTSVLDTLRALAGKIDALVGKPVASADKPRTLVQNETSPARPRPWRRFDKSGGTACVVDAGGVHICDATKADAELIVEGVNTLTLAGVDLARPFRNCDVYGADGAAVQCSKALGIPWRHIGIVRKVVGWMLSPNGPVGFCAVDGQGIDPKKAGIVLPDPDHLTKENTAPFRAILEAMG